MERETVLVGFLRRLDALLKLDSADIDAIRSLPVAVRHVRSGEVIVFDGERPKECCLVIEGFCMVKNNNR